MTVVVASPVSLRAPLDADDIRRILPHSWPFLFLDRVTELEPGVRGVGLKNVTIAENHFAGHFPHESIMPGVLIVESLAQLTGIVSLSDGNASVGGRGYLVAIKRMRFRTPARPGDQLVLHALRTAATSTIAEYHVKACVRADTIADGSLTIAL